MSDDRQEAYESFNARVADMVTYLRLDDEGYDVMDENEAPEDLGPASEYGLAWDLDTTDHRHGTRTYTHVLSTGGPHDEFQVTFDPNKGTVTDALFVYLPWFGREEIRPTGDDAETVRAFYERYYGGIVEAENEALNDNS